MSAPRRKLPAYGKALMLERRQGRHPREVTLVYGDDWHAGDAPRICIRPLEYAPGRYSFAMCAGCRVVVLDQQLAAWDCDPAATPARYGPIYDLIGELTDAGAAVVVRWPASAGERERSAVELAYGAKRGAAWPRWWSDARHAAHDRALIGWLEDGFKLIERQLSQPQGERAEAA